MGPNSNAEAAIMIINTGGRDVVVDKFTVRGQEIIWNNVYYVMTSQSISGDLTYVSFADLDVGESVPIGTGLTFSHASNDLTLPSGQTLIIYIKSPDSVSVNDVGLTVSITVFTSQAMYHKETNVQGVRFSEASRITQSQINIWYDGDGNQMSLVLTNNGASSETITDLLIAGNEFNSDSNEGWETWMYYAVGNFAVGSTLPYNNHLTGEPFSVEGQALSVVTEGSDFTSFSIPAGQTAIIYCNRLWWLDSEVGQSVAVDIVVQGVGTVNLGSAEVATYTNNQ
jgi:hypothetical protein